MVTEMISQLGQIAQKLKRHHRRSERSRIGQFLTPAAIAQFMARLFERDVQHVRLLDAGAGAGILFAAVADALIARNRRPQSIYVVAYENDEVVLPYLEEALCRCGAVCTKANVGFHAEIRVEDFVKAGVALTQQGLFSRQREWFTHAILNPPYKKINGESETRKLLAMAGMDVSNLYAAFVWLAAKMLNDGGEIVAITPRSFCNGPYFRRFRVAMLDMITLRQIHLFESRNKAFSDDDVLQENVIFYAVRSGPAPKNVIISSSVKADFHKINVRRVSYDHVVFPNDRDAFIYLVLNDDDEYLIEQMEEFRTSLAELGMEVSTGRVVDFRAREYLRLLPEDGTVPLVYPCHFKHGFVRWPAVSEKKPSAIVSAAETRDLVVTAGYYVLTKRFSAKEERRRVVAAIYDPHQVEAPLVGFENHLNYFHAAGKGLPSELAKGLAVYLNSTLFDRYFRLFSGHTQVNATDLRKMRYPTREQLVLLGSNVKTRIPEQEAVDTILEKVCKSNG